MTGFYMKYNNGLKWVNNPFNPNKTNFKVNQQK